MVSPCFRIVIRNLKSRHNSSLIFLTLAKFRGLCVRESIPRQVDKKSGVTREEKGVWNSQREIMDKHLFFFFFLLSTFLSLSHIKHFFFKPRTDDYTTNSV